MAGDSDFSGFELTPEQERLIALLNRKESLKPLALYYKGALFALSNPANPEYLSQASQSMRELFEKFPEASGIEMPKVDKTQFFTVRDQIEAALNAARPAHGWGGEISDELKAALALMEQYLAMNKGPTRQEQTALGIAATNPFLEFSSEKIQTEIKAAFRRCSLAFQGYAHHERSDRSKFLKVFALAEAILLAILNPPPSQALVGIREVVKLDPGQLSKAQLNGVFEHLSHRDENYDFFFRNVSRPEWVAVLWERGYFAAAPGIERRGEGYGMPLWPPLSYLARVANQVPEEAVTICCQVPPTDNPRIYMEITNVAIAVDVDRSIRLKEKLIEGANLPIQILGDGYGAVVRHWATNESGIPAALELAQHLVRFKPDPNHDEKIKSTRQGVMGFFDALEGRPKFDSWQYHRILNGGIAALTCKAPLPMVRILADAVMEFLGFKHEDSEAALVEYKGDDFSDSWCRRINAPSAEYVEADEVLIHSLTRACVELCRHSGAEGALVLDQILSSYPWRIFSRIRHYIYGQFPQFFRDQIRALILTHAEYGDMAFNREEVEAVRGGCEYYGRSLLGEGEFLPIGDMILAGPDYASYKEWLGDEFKESLYEGRRDYVHRQHLWPFEAILDGKYAERLREVMGRVSGEASLDNYEPTPMEGSQTGGSKSPIEVDILSAKSDDELISIVNEWNDSRRDNAEWWITIDREGLASAFGGCIHQNPDRFLRWTDQWNRINRPMFLRAAIDAVTMLIDAQHLDRMPSALRLCDVILAKEIRIDISPNELSPESDTHPAWDRARRGVASFAERCLEKDLALPAEWSDALGNIIRQLCLSQDPYLDRETDVFLAGSDILNAAIGTTRGRGLRLLVSFNLWARNFGDTSPSAIYAKSLLHSILGERFAGHPLITAGELALLALHFGALATIDPDWTRTNLPNLFPRQSDPQLWAAAFGYLVLQQNAHNIVFDLLGDEYQYAVNNLDLLRAPVEGNYRQASKIEAVGSHLFFYFIWGRIPLKGNDSLLETFYANTTSKEWAAVMRRAGRAIHRSSIIDADIKEHACAFVDHRLSLAEESTAGDRVVELEGLTNWISAKELDPAWRLRTLHRALLIGRYISSAMPLVEALRELVPADPAVALQCFAQIAEWATDPTFYIDPDHGKAILATGLAHSSATINESATAAKERLLGAGRYEYL